MACTNPGGRPPVLLNPGGSALLGAALAAAEAMVRTMIERATFFMSNFLAIDPASAASARNSSGDPARIVQPCVNRDEVARIVTKFMI